MFCIKYVRSDLIQNLMIRIKKFVDLKIGANKI